MKKLGDVGIGERAVDRWKQARQLHREQQLREEALLGSFEHRKRSCLGPRVQRVAAVGIDNPGFFEGIAQVGSPLELYERPDNEFVAQFIGSPAMNLLPGEIVETGAQTKVKLAGGGIALSDVATEASDMGRSVNVGVRPEDFTLAGSATPMIEGVVDFTEALGEVTLLYFMANGDAEPLIGKLPGIHKDLRGQSVSLVAAPEKVHLFAGGLSLRK